MAKAVGVDIGSRACKVAVLSGGPKGARLVRYAEKEYDYGAAGALTPAAVLTALKHALSEARAPRNSVCVAIPAELCTLREITVPFTEDDQIKKVVKFEFEPHLHSASIEDVVIDYVKTGKAKGGTRLLVIAASKAMLRARLDQLKEAGIDPLHLDVDVAAIFNVAKQSGVFAEHPNCLIIDIGARTTKTLLIQNGAMKVVRSIRIGAQSASQRLTSDFEGDSESARQAMAAAGGVEALAQPPEHASTLEIIASVSAIEAAAAGSHDSEFLSRVLRETQRTLPILGDDKPLTRIFLTGAGADRAHARQRIADHFHVDVDDLPTMKALTHSLPPSDADRIARSGAVAIGAAFKVLGVDAGEIDLRREEFRFARTFDAIKVAIATGVTLVFFGCFLVAFTKMQERKALRTQRTALINLIESEVRVAVLEDYDKSVKDARKESEADRAKSGDESFYFARMRTRLRETRDHLKNELGLATEVPPIRSCLETWAVVMNAAKAVRDKIPYFAIREEDYTQEKATLKVIVGDFPDMDKFVMELKKHDDIFESVDTDKATPVKDKGYEYSIKIVLKVKETVELAKTAETGSLPATGEKQTAAGEGR